MNATLNFTPAHLDFNENSFERSRLDECSGTKSCRFTHLLVRVGTENARPQGEKNDAQVEHEAPVLEIVQVTFDTLAD